MSYAHPRTASRMATGLVVTVVLHIVLVYALITGLARKIVEVVRAPLETKIIEEVKAPPPPDKPPPPPPPKLAPPPPPFIPPPEVRVQVPVAPPPTITVAPTPPPPAPVEIKPVPPPPPPPAPVRLATAPETIADSCERPPYPPQSRRAGETGEVRFRVIVDANGKVVDATMERSSGSRRLDEASRQALMECRYRPGIGSDGRPIRAAVTKVYTWRLTD